LLDRFVAHHGDVAEAAFGALVGRHGPMVLHVCRTILHNSHDAEDASQAVFLVLAQRARAIRNRDSVASWLFGVACRVSARVKRDAARRREHERQRAELMARTGALIDGPSRSEAWELLYEALDRLPEAYRAVIVLCDLEGLTHEQAAHQLQGSVRTVQRRLEQGRRRLRHRLAAHDPALACVLPAQALTVSTLSPAQTDAVRRAAVQVATNSGAIKAGAVSASVAALAEGVLKTMTLNMIKLTAIACFGAGLLAGGLATQVHRAGSAAVLPRSRDSASTRPEAATSLPLALALAPDKPAAARELTQDNGKPAGKKSLGGSGHAVRFEAPGEGWSLTSIRLHGARYGYPKPPAEDFNIIVCDENFQTIATFPFPYSTFKRGPEGWVKMDVKPTKVPAKFVVFVDFDPAATKGVYVSHDGEKSEPGVASSLTGVPGDKARPFVQGHWLIRAVVEPPKSPGTPG
jgi:RNA polymerase sigma-70 factor (ECF subfamily)